MKGFRSNIGREKALVEAPGGLVASPRVARCLWFEGIRQVALREMALPALQGGEALVQMVASGISRGTERLVLSGHVPPSEYERMRAPFQRGTFPFPVQYGYCAVGRVISGPQEWVGKKVFALHPHQDFFILPTAALTVLPEALPAKRAVLVANMETALNGLWDSGVQIGDKIGVIGAGAVGMLIAALCAKLPASEVLLADIAPDRAALANAFGARFINAHQPANFLKDCDVVFHTSASAQGLALALASAGSEARVIEMSWYGSDEVAVPLGGAFHSRRLHISASQVGTIPPSHRARWSFARRLVKAVELLDNPVFDLMITQEIAFSEAPLKYPLALAAHAPGLVSVLTYP